LDPFALICATSSDAIEIMIDQFANTSVTYTNSHKQVDLHAPAGLLGHSRLGQQQGATKHPAARQHLTRTTAYCAYRIGASLSLCPIASHIAWAYSKNDPASTAMAGSCTQLQVAAIG
jgi:hypothetical protein